MYIRGGWEDAGGEGKAPEPRELWRVPSPLGRFDQQASEEIRARLEQKMKTLA